MENKVPVIIIDDEVLARKRLKKLLIPYADRIEIIGEADNGASGLDLAETKRPDFIFLDIQMPVLNGFEMLPRLTYQPYIIFTTAYDEYAIQAFETNSIDYLLKPIRSERLAITVEKMFGVHKKATQKLWQQDQLETLIASLKPNKSLRTITVQNRDKMTIVNLKEVALFQSEDKLTVMQTVDGKRHLLTHSLNQLEQKLPDHFIRLNRSAIVNEDEILEVRKGFNGKLVFVMKHDENIKITTGSSYTSAVKARLRF